MSDIGIYLCLTLKYITVTVSIIQPYITLCTMHYIMYHTLHYVPKGNNVNCGYYQLITLCSIHSVITIHSIIPCTYRFTET